MRERVKYGVLALLSAILLLGVSQADVKAYAADGATTVYVTDTGSCYHSDGCRYLSESKIATTLEFAVNAGYRGCSKCSPPVLDSASTAASNKTAVNTKAAASVKDVAPSAGDVTVYLSATGSKYHSINNCGNMNPAKATKTTESKAIAKGMAKCSKCW